MKQQIPSIDMAMSFKTNIQGGSAGESIKGKRAKLLQHFATALVRFNTFRRGKR